MAPQTEWREDIKKFTRLAGGEGTPCVFLFSDSQIKQESFVEDINNLLNSGEVWRMSGGDGPRIRSSVGPKLE